MYVPFVFQRGNKVSLDFISLMETCKRNPWGWKMAQSFRALIVLLEDPR